MTSPLPKRPRTWVVLAAVLAGLVVVLLSPSFGRAEVTGGYRPELPLDGLTSGCYPLPGDVELGLTAVLRSDSDVLDADGLHRRMVLHYDDIDGAGAVRRVEAAFAEAGVADQVSVRARDFEVPDDAVVRGELVLDLPVGARDYDIPGCGSRYLTKRFGPDLADRS